jgi:hypothetical protein
MKLARLLVSVFPACRRRPEMLSLQALKLADWIQRRWPCLTLAHSPPFVQ